MKTFIKFLVLSLFFAYSGAKVNAQCTPVAGTYNLSTTPYNGVWDFTSIGLNWDTYVVQTGTTVVFNGANAVFPDNSKILVQPGGTLLVQGSTLAVKCSGSKWTGIEVQGNSTQPFSSTNGFVNIYNSQISDAIIAVNLIDNGGCQAYTSSFINNDKGIKIVGNNFSGGYPWAIYECDFDWNYIDPTMTIAHIDLNMVDGIGFYGCNFSNSSTSTVTVPSYGSIDYLQRGAGIKHQESELLVTNSGSKSNCGNVMGGRKSTFTNLGVGIYMEDLTSNTNQMVVVEYSKFTNNFWGVYSRGIRIYDIQDNRFEFTDGTDYFSAGAVNVWSGHVIFGNNNNAAQTNIVNHNTFSTYQNSNFSVGVAGEWSSFDYHIRNNIFIYSGDILNSWGVRFDFHNPSPAISKITCNKFTGTDIDIALYNCTGTNQIGDVNDPANNQFSNTNISIDIIGNNPFPMVAYYKNAASPSPVNSVNANPVINTNTLVKCIYCEIQPRLAPERGDNPEPGNPGMAAGEKVAAPAWIEYPTPGRGHYTLLPVGNLTQGDVTVKIFDIAGKEILSTTANGANEISVDISLQPTGIYIYHIVQNGQTYFTGKLIKE